MDYNKKKSSLIDPSESYGHQCRPWTTWNPSSLKESLISASLILLALILVRLFQLQWNMIVCRVVLLKQVNEKIELKDINQNFISSTYFSFSLIYVDITFRKISDISFIMIYILSCIKLLIYIMICGTQWWNWIIKWYNDISWFKVLIYVIKLKFYITLNHLSFILTLYYSQY
jgi:hypothetical protein